MSHHLTLGIESSCDETAAAVVSDGRVALSNIVLSQPEHSRFGGVVPEVASRAHVRTVAPIFREALDAAGVDIRDIDSIAATRGPGLVGCLLVGLTFAKGLAQALERPFIAVNHLEGHIAANFLGAPDLSPHHLTLIISGGHTMLVEVQEFGKYRTLGRTRDDAVGEAFDKVAKMVGLGYPGGHKIDKLAREGRRGAIDFPRPMINSGDYDFSFSGLKTAVAQLWKSLSDAERETMLADIAASFQEAAVETLVSKTLRAAEDLQVTTITLSGGVAANSRLRESLEERLSESGLDFRYPPRELCTDNAAMIASAGYFRYKSGGASAFDVDACPNLGFE